jgi:hypothetical protein
LCYIYPGVFEHHPNAYFLRFGALREAIFCCAAAGGEETHCEKWLRKSATCWKRLAEARHARMKSYYTAVSTSAAVLVGMLAL